MISKKAENLIKMNKEEFLTNYIPYFIVLNNNFFVNFANFDLQESMKNFLNTVSKLNADEASKVVEKYKGLVDGLSIDIKKLPLKESIPYCVRSSFFEDMDNLSFTGRFESILDVKIQKIEDAIKQVIKSYYSYEMIQMYDNINYDDQFEPTIIIQEMKGHIDNLSDVPVLSGNVLNKIRNIASVIEEKIIKGPSDIELVIEENEKSYSGVLFTQDPLNSNNYLTLRITSGVGTAVGKSECEQTYYISRVQEHIWEFCKENTNCYLDHPDIWVVQSRNLKVSKYTVQQNVIDTSNYKAVKGDIISSSDKITEDFLICADLKTAWSTWLNSKDKHYSIAVQNGSLLEHEAILLREKNVFVCRIYLPKLIDLQYVKAFFDTNKSMFYFLDEKQSIIIVDSDHKVKEDFTLQILNARNLMDSFHRPDLFAKSILNCDHFLLECKEYENNTSLFRNIIQSIIVNIAIIALHNNLYSQECEDAFLQFKNELVVQEVYVEWIMHQESKQSLAKQYGYDKELIQIAVKSKVDEITAVYVFHTYLSNCDLKIQDKRIIFTRLLKYDSDVYFNKNCDWKSLCNKVHNLEIDLNTFFNITENIFGPWFIDYFLSLNEKESKRITDQIFNQKFVQNVFVELSDYYKSNEMLLLKNLLSMNQKQIYDWFQEYYETFHNTLLVNSIFSILSESYDLVCKVCLTNIQEYIQEYYTFLSAWIDILVYLNERSEFDNITNKSVQTLQEFISKKEIYNYDVSIDDFWINVVEDQEITNLHVLHNIVHQTCLYLIENYFKLDVKQKEYVEIYEIINVMLGQRSQYINSIFGHTELQLSLSQHKSSIVYSTNEIILRYMSAQGTEEICTENRKKAIIYWLKYIERDDIHFEYQDIKSGSSGGLYISIKVKHNDYDTMKDLTRVVIAIITALAGFSLLTNPIDIKAEINDQKFMLKKLIEYSKNKYYTEYKVGSKASVQSNLLTEVCLDPEHYDWIGQVLSYALDDFIDAIKDKLLNVEVMNECTGKSHSWLLMSIAGLIISMIYPEEVFPLIMQHGLDENISEDAICRYLFTNKMILEKAFSMYKQNNTEIANYLVRYAPSYIIHLWKCEDVNIDSFLEADEQVNGNLLKCFAALEMETLCTDPKLQLYYEKYLAYCENYHEGKYRICDSDLGAIYLSRKSYDYLMKTNSPACTKIKNILANNLVVDCNQFDYTFYFDMDGGI